MKEEKQIAGYFQNAPEPQKEILQALRSLILKTIPQAKEEYKWSRPVYSFKKDFCYLAFSKNHATMGFMNAEKLSDPDKKLEGTGKSMRHIKLTSVTEINPALIKRWLKEAVQ